MLAGKSAAERAAELINGSHLDDPAFRRELYQGGQVAIDAAADPMIELLRQIDPVTRTTRKDLEDHVDSVVRRNGALVAKTRFALYGMASAPDATGTLRLSYGAVKSYIENGKRFPITPPLREPFSTRRRTPASTDYKLPESYHRAKDKLDLNTVLDTVNTGDSIGGNSGSPVVNTKGELVGILFDGNIDRCRGTSSSPMKSDERC